MKADKKMKFLIISDAWHPQINGVVRTYEYIVEELEKAGHEVLVIGPSDFTYVMSMPGYSEIKLAVMPYRGLIKKIDNFAPDTIHVATEGPLGLAGRKYCVRRGRAFSTSFHTHFPEYVSKRVAKKTPALKSISYTLTKSYIKWFHKKSHGILLSTKSMAQMMRSWGIRTPVFPLTRGVKTAQFFPMKKNAPKTVLKDLKAPIALYVGRVAIEKNIESFLKMDWTGSKIIVGNGPALNSLRKKYSNVVFKGSLEGQELAACYREADIFVFPSKTDTFGIVLIEALASGLPVAAYPVAGPKDIITQDYLGVLDADITAASRGALALCDVEGTAEKRAKHARAHYTWAKAAKQFEIAQRKIEKP